MICGQSRPAVFLSQNRTKFLPKALSLRAGSLAQFCPVTWLRMAMAQKLRSCTMSCDQISPAISMIIAHDMRSLAYV